MRSERRAFNAKATDLALMLTLGVVGANALYSCMSPWLHGCNTLCSEACKEYEP